MSLLKRISNLVRSNVNDVLDKAEDPKKILDQTILDMQQEHKKAKGMLLETMTLLKQTEKQAENHKKQAAEWEAKAMAALRGGKEDLARQALEEKQKSEELALEAEKGVGDQKVYTEQLKTNLTALEQKIEESKRKRDELVARIQAAEAKKRQADMRASDTGKNHLTDNAAFSTFDRMVEKIENSEAEVEARRELMGTTDFETEAEFNKQLKASSADDALEQLKAKMAAERGGSAPAPAPKPADAITEAKADAIEDQLAALRAKLDAE